MTPSLLATVTNYDFSENADRLKNALSDFFETILIDSSSPKPPKFVDITLPNLYYSGLWNEAVRRALLEKKEWLLFVASDVEIFDPSALATHINEVTQVENIGIYTPSLVPKSRTSFDYCRHLNTLRLRECHLIEGFFFLARTKILEHLYPIDVSTNRYGWGVDVLASYYAYKLGLKVVVDDRVQIYHPAARHSISLSEAEKQFKEYLVEANAYWFYKRTRIILKLKREFARLRRKAFG
jgi:hypothetical protein